MTESTPQKTPTTPALKSRLPIRTHYPRREILAYKAQRTSSDIAMLKEYIVTLDRELKRTRMQILELERGRGRVPRLVEVEDLLDGNRKWVEEVSFDEDADIDAEYDPEEHRENDRYNEKLMYPNKVPEEDWGIGQETEIREDVYVLDGGETVISVQEIEVCDDEEEGELVVKVSKVTNAEEGERGVVMAEEEKVLLDGEGASLEKELENLDELNELETKIFVSLL